jgi:hypothetical protein
MMSRLIDQTLGIGKTRADISISCGQYALELPDLTAAKKSGKGSNSQQARIHMYLDSQLGSFGCFTQFQMSIASFKLGKLEL